MKKITMLLILAVYCFIVTIFCMETEISRLIELPIIPEKELELSDSWKEITIWKDCELLSTKFAISSKVFDENACLIFKNGTPNFFFKPKNNISVKFKLSQDQQYLAVLDPFCNITIYDILQTKPIYTLNDFIRSFEFYSPTLCVLVKNNDFHNGSKIKLYDFIHNKKINTLKNIKNLNAIVSLIYPRLLCYCEDFYRKYQPENQSYNGKLIIWNFVNNEIGKIETPTPYFNVLKSDFNTCFAGSYFSKVYLFNCHSLNKYSILEHPANVMTLAFAGNNHLVTGTNNVEGSVRLWDKHSLTCLQKWNFKCFEEEINEHFFYSPIYAIQCSPTKILISNGLGKALSLRYKKRKQDSQEFIEEK